jgi:hypothetical protein
LQNQQYLNGGLASITFVPAAASTSHGHLLMARKLPLTRNLILLALFGIVIYVNIPYNLMMHKAVMLDEYQHRHIPNLPPVTLSLRNLLWSRNWYTLATCDSVPLSYYTLENASEWCQEYYKTECSHSPKQMVDYFSGCRGTIWLRLQSKRKWGGDITTFIKHVLPLLKEPFELITTDGDSSVPSDIPEADKLLASPLLTAWYTQNYDGTPHPKIHPVPIGLDLHSDQKERPGLWSTDKEENFRQMMLIRKKGFGNTSKRSKTFWIPPMAATSSDRQLAHEAAECLEHSHSARMPVNRLWEEYTKYRFGFSPTGNGLDCHRTWEMIFFGMVPIVKTCSLDPLYTELPVLIVKEWTDICQEGFLDKVYDEMAPLLVQNDEILTMEYYRTLARRLTQNRSKVFPDQA